MKTKAQNINKDSHSDTLSYPTKLESLTLYLMWQRLQNFTFYGIKKYLCYLGMTYFYFRVKF